MLLAILTFTGLNKEWFPVSNTLAYLTPLLVTMKKCLKRFPPGVNVIKLFSIITDDEAQ
jgi:hypothetical protein